MLPTGRKQKLVDARTLRFKDVSAPWPGVPASYSWDGEHPGAVPVPMFANDRLGDCVIAGRAHQTLRMEYAEQGAAIPLTEQEVIDEYFRESGGLDSGLYLLESLKSWRRDGWTAGGKTYRIHSFLDVSPQIQHEVMEAMLVGLGVQIGVGLPLSAFDQMNAGEPWDLIPGGGERTKPFSAGGHLMWSGSYDPTGVEFVTWGKRQRATWRWVRAYCDECFLIIDDINRPDVTARVDIGLLGRSLERIHG